MSSKTRSTSVAFRDSCRRTIISTDEVHRRTSIDWCHVTLEDIIFRPFPFSFCRHVFPLSWLLRKLKTWKPRRRLFFAVKYLRSPIFVLLARHRSISHHIIPCFLGCRQFSSDGTTCFSYSEKGKKRFGRSFESYVCGGQISRITNI